MGDLTLRGLDDEVLARLSQRAAQHGRSVEEEVVAIVTSGLTVEPVTAARTTPADFRQRLRLLREETRGMIKASTAEILEESRNDRR